MLKHFHWVLAPLNSITCQLIKVARCLSSYSFTPPLDGPFSVHNKSDPTILFSKSVGRSTSVCMRFPALSAMVISALLVTAGARSSFAQGAGYCLAQCNARCYHNSTPSCAASCTSWCMAGGRNSSQQSSPLWGAVAAAHPPEIGNGIAWDYNIRSAAVSAALNECHKYASHCDLLLAYSGPSCAAYTTASDATHVKNFGTYAHIARTSTDAIQGSLEMCLLENPADQCETHPDMAKCNSQ